MLWYNYQDNIVFILFMFKVAMFIVYFDYMLSIVSLSMCLCISSYSAHPNDHRVGGRDHVSMVLRCYLPTNTLYILGHVVDRGCATTIESFVVHSPNIGHRSRARLQRKGKLYSRTSQSNAPYV
jgi:type 1 fimbria pilin